VSFLSLWLGSSVWSGGVYSTDGPRVGCVGWSDGSSGRPPVYDSVVVSIHRCSNT
jgi:hypothetical protein